MSSFFGISLFGKAIVVLGFVLWSMYLHAAAPDVRESLSIEMHWYVTEEAAIPEGVQAIRDANAVVGFKMSFDLPRQCGDMDEIFDAHGFNTDGRGVRLLAGARVFCDRIAFLDKYPKVAKHDFISSVDIGELPLEFIPRSLHCGGVASSTWIEFCEKLRTNDPSICSAGDSPSEISYLSFAAIFDSDLGDLRADCRPVFADPESCRLSDYQFLGKIKREAGRIRCSPDDFSDGVQVYALHYRDVNSDGFLDVVLHLSTVTSASGPEVRAAVALSRLSIDSPLLVVEQF